MLLAQSSQSRGRPLLFVVSALPMEAMAGGGGNLGKPNSGTRRRGAARSRLVAFMDYCKYKPGTTNQARKYPAEEEVSGAIQTELKKVRIPCILSCIPLYLPCPIVSSGPRVPGMGRADPSDRDLAAGVNSG